MKSPAGLEALALNLRAPGSNRTVVVAVVAVMAVVPTDYLATPSLALSFSLAWEWQYHTFLTNLGALYLTEFLTDFGQILDSNSYDQAQQTL